jgi:hypothetical protein
MEGFDENLFAADWQHALRRQEWNRVFEAYCSEPEGSTFEVECRLGCFYSKGFHALTPLAWMQTYLKDRSIETVTVTEKRVDLNSTTKWRQRDGETIVKEKWCNMDFLEWGIRLALSIERPSTEIRQASSVTWSCFRWVEHGLSLSFACTGDSGRLEWEVEMPTKTLETYTAFMEKISEFGEQTIQFLKGFQERYQCWSAMIYWQHRMPQALYFPLKWGSTPAMFCPRHVTDILQRPEEWAVSLKADGERSYLFLLETTAIRFDRRGHCHPVSVQHIPHSARWSILDGEWFQFTFYVFDILARQGKWLRRETQQERWSLWRQFEGLHTPHHPAAIFLKPFFTGTSEVSLGAKAQELWNQRRSSYVSAGGKTKQPYQLPPFLADGLVFTSLHAVPTVTLKWRPFHTIDVWVGSRVRATEEFEYQAIALDKQERVVVPRVRIIHLHPLVEGTIVEIVHFREDCWSVLRTRPDKSFPNQWSPTIVESLEYIKQPVHLTALSTSHYATNVARPVKSSFPFPTPVLVSVRVLYEREQNHVIWKGVGMGVGLNRSSPDLSWREFCNFLKRSFIDQEAPQMIVDVGAGKASDLSKWMECKSIQWVIAFEPSVDQIHHPKDGFITRVLCRPDAQHVSHEQYHSFAVPRVDGEPLNILLFASSCDECPVSWWELVADLSISRVLVTNFFSIHYWCLQQNIFERTVKKWKVWMSNIPGSWKFLITAMDMSQFPDEPPDTDLKITVVKGSLPWHSRVVTFPSPWTRRDYIQFWATKPKVTFQVHWSHWNQSIQEDAVHLPSLLSCFQYHQLQPDTCLSFAEWSEHHAGSELPANYIPWSRVFHVFTLTPPPTSDADKSSS